MTTSYDRIGRGVRSHTIGDGSKTVTTAGTAEALSATALPVDFVSVTAKIANTGTVAVGSSTVVAAAATQRGAPLLAGESISIGAVDLSLVYIDATVSGEGVTFMYVT